MLPLDPVQAQAAIDRFINNVYNFVIEGRAIPSPAEALSVGRNVLREVHRVVQESNHLDNSICANAIEEQMPSVTTVLANVVRSNTNLQLWSQSTTGRIVGNPFERLFDERLVFLELGEAKAFQRVGHA